MLELVSERYQLLPQIRERWRGVRLKPNMFVDDEP
jgi:hypothetical protein